jgi:hypothetical protein
MSLRPGILTPFRNIGRSTYHPPLLKQIWRNRTFPIVRFCFGFCGELKVATVVRGRNTRDAAEGSGEMLLVLEADGQRNFEHGQLRIPEHLVAAIDSKRKHVFVRARARADAELVAEVGRAEARLRRQITEPHLPIEIGVHEVENAAQALRRQAARPQLRLVERGAVRRHLRVKIFGIAAFRGRSVRRAATGKATAHPGECRPSEVEFRPLL